MFSFHSLILRSAISLFSAGIALLSPARGDEVSVRDFTRDVLPILNAYCAGCHNPDVMEGNLSLASFGDIIKGLEAGPLVVPGKPEESKLFGAITGETEPKMPPDDFDAPNEDEIALIRSWIEQGAKGPAGGTPQEKALDVPSIKSEIDLFDSPVTAVAMSPDNQSVAIGRFGHLALNALATGTTLFSLEDLPGKVNAIQFTADGTRLVIATGTTGVSGQAILVDVATGDQLRTIAGHGDILYDAELNPEGKLLALASYDNEITIWNVESGEQKHSLKGHNGAVFDVAFSPSGNLLASASADNTVKLWNVTSGERLDTLGQAEAEQFAVAFSPDGKKLVAGGADKRIRVWDIVAIDQPATNPLLFTRVAHNGAVTDLAFSADGAVLLTAGEDQVVKCWETRNFAVAKMLPRLSSHINALDCGFSAKSFLIGLSDGTWQKLERIEVLPSASASPREPPVNTACSTSTAEYHTVEELEPNDELKLATELPVPGKAHGVIKPIIDDTSPDSDMYRFNAKSGETWILEVNAARSGSSLDSRLEILDGSGRRIERVRLQATRDSYLKYRGQSSEELNDFRFHNWEEMEINEHLYVNGDVMKLWHYPRGVDSGYIMYPGIDKRFSYFGTTAITHALNEPAYTVVPLPPGTKTPPSTLPVFPIYFENDDDPQRQLGADSYVRFTAPADGQYIAVVTDVRGFSGDSFGYELHIRRPQPDFEVTVELENTAIPCGSGREFLVKLQRKDGFDGEVTIDMQNLPSALSASTPLVVQAEQVHAYGTINASPDATEPQMNGAEDILITAHARIAGKDISKEVPAFGDLSLGEPPKVKISIVPAAHAGSASTPFESSSDTPVELTIAPGETISAIVQVERQKGFNEEVSLGVDLAGRNLPHGVYVDNIGLNGLLIAKGEDQREFFITAAPWVRETTRMFHLRAVLAEGNLTSLPVVLHVVQRSAPAANP